ncbi:hypothetical protein BX667DRAFT_521130 [Coemansia mojavensis]|nr:hypothetical protein BX667DRAFT_521130 [Coemansia mojavensis]
MNNVLNRLANITAVWPNVSKLVLQCGYGFNGYNEIDQAEQEAIATKLPERFVQMFPHVKKLLMNDTAYYDVHKNLYVNLANKYLDQLQVLVSSREIQPIQNCANLKVLRVRFVYNSQHVSQRINAESLVKLTLLNMHSTNLWLLFKNVFSNLRYLDYSYGGHQDVSSESLQLQLRFPSLSILKINCLQSNCPVLANGMFPDSIDELDVKLSSASAALFKNMNLYKIGNFRATINCLAANMPSISAALASLARKTDGNIGIAVNIDNGLIEPLLSCRLSYIASLFTSAYVALDQVLGILQNGPDLRKLTLLRLQPATNEANLPVLPDADSQLPPVHLNVTSLSFGTMPLQEVSYRTIMYLVLVSPALNKLVLMGSESTKRWFTKAFANYKHSYPHLDNITIVL